MTYGDTCGNFKLCYPKVPLLSSCTECLDYWAPKSELTVKLSGGKFGIYPYLPPNQTLSNGARPGHTATPSPATTTVDADLTIPIAVHTLFGWRYEHKLHDPAYIGINPTFGYGQGVSDYAIIPNSFREFAVSPAPFAGNPATAYVEVGVFLDKVDTSCIDNVWQWGISLGICHTPFYFADSNEVQTNWLSSGSNPYTYADYLIGRDEFQISIAATSELTSLPDSDCRKSPSFDISMPQNQVSQGWLDLEVTGFSLVSAVIS